MGKNVKKMNLEYVNNSVLKAMKALPKEIALQFATDLQRVQEGKSPLSDFKHLKGIGQGGVIINRKRQPGLSGSLLRQV
ncbi:phage-related protein [Rhizobium leguminosarum]|nr:phage-related protein [Rhizobium leguminosarum]